MPQLSPDFVRALCGSYADFLRRQRSEGTASLTDWPTPNSRRAPEFMWLGGGDGQRERMMSNLEDLRLGAADPGLSTVSKICATITLNPYEREALYGYPFLIGKIGTQVIRAPLLMIPVTVTPDGRGFVISPTEGRAEFNPFPFFTDATPAARDLALARLSEVVPALPLTPDSLRQFVDALQREIEGIEVPGRLDGQLAAEPERPTGAQDFLQVIEQAAILVAPQASYFLVSDLQKLSQDATATDLSCIIPLLGGAGDERQVDITTEMELKSKVIFPFPSNRAQRRVAILLDDPTTRVIRVDGPPGTGKSLTIANIVCHLAAHGKSVLVTSQKDKALQVVDEKLRALNSPLLPMTLLHRDKKPLLERLALIRKERSQQEIDAEVAQSTAAFERARAGYSAIGPELAKALEVEDQLVKADTEFAATAGLRRLLAKFGHSRKWAQARRRVPRSSDELSELAAGSRDEITELAVSSLQLLSESRIAGETRAERQNREELSKVVRRDQSSFRNFSLFDRLKAEPDRAAMLLRSLPAWIMAPDDVARLFPCEEGLFDVVIVDEASQVDLPSILPILYRGKKIVICGDAHQMQPKRFAFTSGNTARAAWQKHNMPQFDPDERFYPTRQSLLELAQTRAEEAVFLDEHFRSLPSIISFSNDRWYGSQMRIMTDETLKEFGGPDTPAFTLHSVDGLVASGTQVNEAEAHALVDHLKSMLTSPNYDGASFAVLCLFLDQMDYIQGLVADEIDEDVWRAHDLVVLNPDGMQGDERDVILYSLSYDAKNMTRQQLSPRLQEQAHIQGMLNVAFTRPRHEVHIFHSAPIAQFGFAGDRPSALSEWLGHAQAVMNIGRMRHGIDRGGKVDSQFEADVADALRRRGYIVNHQYPACGFWIDIVVESGGAPGRRLAVECDGEIWHQDEHGAPKLADLDREEILERAGWDLLRIPYSAWRKNPSAQVKRVEEYFGPEPNDETHDAPGADAVGGRSLRDPAANHIVAGIKSGLHAERDVAKYVATKMGYDRLGSRIKDAVVYAAEAMAAQKLLVIESNEWYLTAQGRAIEPVDGWGQLTYRPRRRSLARTTRRAWR